MTTIAGADGCNGGWIFIQRNSSDRRVTAAIYPTAGEVLDAARAVDVLGIDIPIGLADSGPRLCDIAARKILGPNRASPALKQICREAGRAEKLPAHAPRDAFDLPMEIIA